ncbi:hypothetical protein [Streptomyces parvulus]|uniref:hypothetical protein n=1 Tax=Streptomyces parvulus TaxID=146923 RepID=UPI001CF9BADC|nr:hypothetical protein [Streptomyces parvulus]
MSGGTPEAEELAHFLRGITKGRTTRALAAEFGRGRTEWSEFLRGIKLIPLWVLENLVKGCVEGPIREARLQQGRELLEAAEAATVKASQTRRPGGSQAELELRLDDARKAQIEAQQTLMGTNQLVIMLLEMVASLQRRCVRLEHERDQALSGHGSSAPSIKKELAETERRIVATEERLQRAREEREEAEDLRVTTHRVAEEHRIALEEMRREAAQDSSAEMDTTGADDPDPQTRPLWEYDRALEVADEQLDAHARRMDRIREEVGLHDLPADESQQVVEGEVVRPDSADNPAPQRQTPQHRPEEGRAEGEGTGKVDRLQAFDAHRRYLDQLWDDAGITAGQIATKHGLDSQVVRQTSTDNAQVRSELGKQPETGERVDRTAPGPEDIGHRTFPQEAASVDRSPSRPRSASDAVRAVSNTERDAGQVREQALHRSPAQFVELYMRVSESEQAVMRNALEERTSGDRVAITILLRDAIHHRRRLPPQPSAEQRSASSETPRRSNMFQVRCWSCSGPTQVNVERLLHRGSWSCPRCGAANKLPT